MALGTWNARGNEYTVALASGVAYCSRSQTPRARCRSTVALCWTAVCSSGQAE